MLKFIPGEIYSPKYNIHCFKDNINISMLEACLTQTCVLPEHSLYVFLGNHPSDIRFFSFLSMDLIPAKIKIFKYQTSFNYDLIDEYPECKLESSFDMFTHIAV